MGSNATSGHTSKLTDGSYIMSPSLTNLIEGVHSNGVILLEDSHTESAHRNTPTSISGAISHGGNHTITIKGGYAVIDGLLVSFANGYGSSAPNTYNVTLVDSNCEGSDTALSSGEQCLFVIYVCSYNDSSRKNIMIQKSSNTTSFPATPIGFLTDPSGLNGSLDLDVKQTVVLGTVRATYQSSGGGDLNVDIQEVFDHRTFIRPSPMYFSPMLDGVIGEAVNGDANRIDSHSDLDGMHGGSEENGAFTSSKFGAMWMGLDDASNNVLYYSGNQDSARRTFRLGPDRMKVYAGNSAQTFKFDGVNHWYITPGANLNLNPSGTFPPGHRIFVTNAASATHNITFDSTGLNVTCQPQTGSIFQYDGSNWKRLLSSGFVSSSSSGGATAIQLGAADGTFSSDVSVFNWSASNVLSSLGPIIMNGTLADVSGISFKASVSSNPSGSNGSVAARTLWLDSDDSRLYSNTSKIALEGDVPVLSSVTEAAIANGDYILFLDGGATGATKKEAFADVATLLSGTGLTASSSVIGIDASQPTITAIGPNNAAVTIGQNLIVTGDLTVNGTTTTINSTTLSVDDKLIELGHSPSGSELNDAGVNGGGIALMSSQGDKSILFADATDSWTFNQHIFPSSDSALNLGSSSVRFATGFVDTINTTLATVGASGITSVGDVVVDTDTLYVDVSEDAVGFGTTSPKAPLQVGDGVGFGYASGSIASNASVTQIVLYNTQVFGGGKLTVEIRNTTDNIYETSELVINHNGRAGNNATEAHVTTYASVRSDGNTATLATYTADINSGNLRLVATRNTASKAYVVKVGWQAFEI